MIDSYFLIPKVIPQIFNSTLELRVFPGTQITEAKAETETHSVTAETKGRNFSK